MFSNGAAMYQSTIEILLDDEVFTTLHRRNRRQLQNIRDSTGAMLELCRRRKVLQVRGSRDKIEAVRRQVQSLNGPRKPVPTAIWAELMRTRTMPLEEGATLPTPNASIAGLQLVSGCRLHMERSKCEVRLFGPDACAEKASQLIDALVGECVEQCIPLGNLAMPSVAVLQTLGEEHSATVVPSEHGIVVLGLRGPVQQAVERIQRCINYEEAWPVPMPEFEEVEVLKLPDQSTPTSRGKVDSIRAGEYSMPALSMLADGGQPQAAPVPHDCPVCCPSCGPARFCTECGAPVANNLGGAFVWVSNDEKSKPMMEPLLQTLSNQAPYGGFQRGPYLLSMPVMNYAALAAKPSPAGVGMMPMMPMMCQA